jgi:hypothetical protein
MRYQQGMEKEVSVIAHSCGVPEVRQLRRHHCRVVQNNGRSVPLDELFPAPVIETPQSSMRKLRN